MPTITIRLTDTEKTDLERTSRVAGKNVSDYVRESLDLREQQATILDVIADLANVVARVERLEEMAGL